MNPDTAFAIIEADDLYMNTINVVDKVVRVLGASENDRQIIASTVMASMMVAMVEGFNRREKMQ